MDDSGAAQNRLCNSALNAEMSGNPQQAVQLYRQAIELNKKNPVPYLYLGYALRALDKADAAVQAWSLAADLDPRVINAWRGDGIDDLVRERSRVADKMLRAHFSGLHRDAVDAWQRRNPQADVSRIAAAIWCQTHDAEFEYADPRQLPHLFFVPGLTPIAVYGDEHMPWKSTLEDACEDIRAEFLAAREVVAEEEIPYLEPRAAWLGEDWVPIADSYNWSSFQLYRKGVPNERLLSAFPLTLDVLQKLPAIRGPEGPREVVFSVLKGNQRIPPHYGVSNTDMTVHLPLITTEDSAIRVAGETHDWSAGKAYAFDDAFDHESWNDSPEPRVNLIFETWHPELSQDEQQAIIESFSARERWNATRQV